MRLFIAGDSTAAPKVAQRRPETGWGELVGDFFDCSVIVRNFARNGRSSKSFVEEGLLADIEGEIGEGDVLLVQFGHNDAKVEDPARFADPDVLYPLYIGRFVAAARDAGAVPVLLSPFTRRWFCSDFELEDMHRPYVEALKRVSMGLVVPFIDVYEISRRIVLSYGHEKSKELFLWASAGEYDNYPDGVSDDTHFNEFGARVFAAVVALSLSFYGVAPVCGHVIKDSACELVGRYF